MHRPAPPGTAAVRLRTAQFRQYAEAYGLSTESDIAGHTGLDRSTLNRLLRGDIAPGNRIVASFLLAFPDRRFEDFFEVEQARAA